MNIDLCILLESVVLRVSYSYYFSMSLHFDYLGRGHTSSCGNATSNANWHQRSPGQAIKTTMVYI